MFYVIFSLLYYFFLKKCKHEKNQDHMSVTNLFTNNIHLWLRFSIMIFFVVFLAFISWQRKRCMKSEKNFLFPRLINIQCRCTVILQLWEVARPRKQHRLLFLGYIKLIIHLHYQVLECLNHVILINEAVKRYDFF